MSAAAAVVVRKEIPAKTKTYLAFGLWIMEKTMTEEEARNKMIEMFIGCETVDGICEKFEAFNEKEMVEKLVQIHKSLKPKKKTEKKKAIESPDNIVNELVSLATNADVNVVPAVQENTNVVPKAKPTEDKKKRAAPKAKPTEDKAKPASVVTENVVAVAPTANEVVSENVVDVAPTNEVKKKRVSKPKAVTESAVTLPVMTESAVTLPVMTESIITEDKKKRASKPKAKAASVVTINEVVATESIVPVATESIVPVATESAVVTEAKANVVPSKPTEDKKKRATPKAKSTSENVVPSNVVPSTNENEVVTSEVKTSENVVPASTEDKKKKPKASSIAKPAVPAVVESPKNDVGVPEEFEDTELVVKEFVYGTKSYYIDEEETIYEQEGLKKIGKLVNGKLVFDSV